MTRFPICFVLLISACGGGNASLQSPVSPRSTSIPSTESGAPAHSSPAALTQRALSMVTNAPDLQLGSSEQLVLSSGAPELEGIEVNLHRIWSHCERVPSECEASLQDYMNQVVATLRAHAQQQSQPLSPQQLLVVMRPQAYIDSVAQQAEVDAERFPGELASMVVLDFPTSARPLDPASRESMSLSEQESRAQALANLQARFNGFAELVQPPPSGQLGRVPTDDFYTSSLLLLTDRWRDTIAPRFQRLLVAVPDPMTLLFLDGADPVAAVAITQIAQAAYQNAERPLSPLVFEWTAEGWRIFVP